MGSGFAQGSFMFSMPFGPRVCRLSLLLQTVAALSTKWPSDDLMSSRTAKECLVGFYASANYYLCPSKQSTGYYETSSGVADGTGSYTSMIVYKYYRLMGMRNM